MSRQCGCGKRSILNIQSNVRRGGATRALGNTGKRPPSKIELRRQSSSDSKFRFQSFFSTNSARMNPPPSWALQMPGFNCPLDLPPDANVISGYISGFPSALDPEHIKSGSLDALVTHREIVMMQIMNHITDKTDWGRKVFDKRIMTKWREEVYSSGQDVTPKMMDWIIRELQWKANILERTGFVEVFGGVVKSNNAIPKELQMALGQAAFFFEDVPEDEKDFHPGSDNKVVDLVHPSLFPMIYGRTHVLPYRTIGLHDCLDSIGEGELLRASPERNPKFQSHKRPPPFSTKFQWLPCEVKRTQGGCSIVSYINNAHPIKHKGLYDVVEKILSRTMPLWEQSLSEKTFQGKRIQFTRVKYENDIEPEPEPNEDTEDSDYDEYEERLSAWYERRKIILPEPGEFHIPRPEDNRVNFLKHFPEGNFQVIVKLANIELTPEKPKYEGGTWHIEGQLNERIVASAIYYYDNKNISPSSIAFRHRGMDDFYGISYEQDRHEFLQQVYGFPQDFARNSWNSGQITQELGSVTSEEGRLITFPNTLQHRVSPFSLEDPSQPGHRKILAIFLVDPHHRIASTANVPPQRQDWRKDAGHSDAQKSITMEEAKAYRAELMIERGLKSEANNVKYQKGSFNLCEH
ncbi:hypothetical protein UA08_01761 [Talaromyces atroroseus]|uniref:Uncharacterized protein n=1 Tax=Talaromyces atroroseus TaxID=1441469 RepID=A0A1Q5QAN9_TALAT|nr:hypothetical protein UA08_01761 [Talaromyces atroroseus]OKL62951.1 hypothetical protein UA08_01761 [Talaromyces atroroseus]